MKRATEVFYQHMKLAGIEVKAKAVPVEKTAASEADNMRESFLLEATQAVLSEVAASIYQDPVLGKLADAGDMKRLARLAEGRYIDAAGASKLASMTGIEFMGIAEKGLRKKLNEKTAELKIAPKKLTLSLPVASR